MAFVCTLASGSSGNAVLVSHRGTHLLVDAGLSRRRLAAALSAWGLAPCDLAAVLVTHEHSDHTSGLPYLSCPVLTGAGTAGYLAFRHPSLLIRELPDGGTAEVGSIGITPFPVPHDAPDTLGFLLHLGAQRVCVCTDLGHVTPEAAEMCARADYLLLEANHDPGMLAAGRYPPHLKRRILGPRGHLSNEAAAALALEAARCGASRLTLCHLSEDNNTPALALQAVSARLLAEGAADSVRVDVAPRHRPGVPWESPA